MSVEKTIPFELLRPEGLLVDSPKDEKAQFNQWMLTIDQYVWQLVGCSMYDLPDYNFGLMFDNRIEPEEAVNGILQESGLELLE